MITKRGRIVINIGKKAINTVISTLIYMDVKARKERRISTLDDMAT